MWPDKLAYMANQIGKFYIGQGHEKAVIGVAEHLAKF
jgi:formate dehydrogenase subunit delta